MALLQEVGYAGSDGITEAGTEILLRSSLDFKFALCERNCMILSSRTIEFNQLFIICVHLNKVFSFFLTLDFEKKSEKRIGKNDLPMFCEDEGKGVNKCLTRHMTLVHMHVECTFMFVYYGRVYVHSHEQS